MRVYLGLGIVMLAASTADAGQICMYSTSYNSPGIGGPACMVDAVEGCPVHLVLAHQMPPLDLMPTVSRNGQDVTVTSTTAVVGSTDAMFTTFDYFSCDCDRVNQTVAFDEIALTITGARAGDIVDVGGGEITIGPATTCAPPEWPTDFELQLGGCDRCPNDPGGDPGSGSGSGCGTTTGSSLVPGVLAVWLATRLRRRR